MTALALVQSGWVVEEVPVVAPPYRSVEAVEIDDTWVGAIGSFSADGGRRPTNWAVFASRADAGVTTLSEFTSWTSPDDGSGTGFTAVVERDGGYEALRVRAEPAPTLVSLGIFPFRVFATSCDPAVSECVVLETNGAVTLWTPTTRRVLLEGGAESNHNPGFNTVNGAALHPSRRFLALALYRTAAVVELATGKVTLFRGNVMATAPSLLKAVDALDDEGKSPLARTLARGNLECSSVPQAWNENALVIAHTAWGDDGEGVCNAQPFEFDVITKQKRGVLVYPWTVLDCPRGGWSSEVGTFVTDCIEEIRARMMPRRRPLADGGWDDGAPLLEELPEAVALSPTQIFVMAPRHPTKWQWFKGKVRKAKERGGLDFVLTGPSVITFQSKGVMVEEVPTWRFGRALFEAPLADDWHLVRAEGVPGDAHHELWLVRLRQE